MVSLTLREIVPILNARVLCCHERLDTPIKEAFGSDLMSDVLAFSPEGTLLLTGLTNVQVVRTSEISGICGIVFVRGKQPDEKVVELAKQFELPLICTDLPMFDSCGLLFQLGLKGFNG